MARFCGTQLVSTCNWSNALNQQSKWVRCTFIVYWTCRMRYLFISKIYTTLDQVQKYAMVIVWTNKKFTWFFRVCELDSTERRFQWALCRTIPRGAILWGPDTLEVQLYRWLALQVCSWSSRSQSRHIHPSHRSGLCCQVSCCFWRYFLRRFRPLTLLFWFGACACGSLTKYGAIVALYSLK